MKILYLFRSLAVWGGIERVLVDKMNWLVADGGMDVYMLTTDQGCHQIPYKVDKKVHLDDLGIYFYQKYQYGLFRRFWIDYQMCQKYKQLLKIRISQIQPDIIVCTTADHIDLIAEVKGDIPLIVESHSICIRTIEQGKSRLLRKLYRCRFLKSLSKVDCIVALTEGDAAEWRCFHHNVRVIPNLLHPRKVKCSLLNLKRVIWVGRFDYQKRVELAIRIWKLVMRTHPDWRLDIYGEGDEFSKIETMALSVGNVYVHNPTTQIFDRYCDSSILISTSLFEPFGLVITEAMSCGLPVIAFNCPYGPADIIQDGMNGFLVPFDNIQCFADKLNILIDDFSQRKKMGKDAFVSSGKYDAVQIMPKWKSLFGEIAKNNSIICKNQK